MTFIVFDFVVGQRLVVDVVAFNVNVVGPAGNTFVFTVVEAVAVSLKHDGPLVVVKQLLMVAQVSFS